MKKILSIGLCLFSTISMADYISVITTHKAQYKINDLNNGGSLPNKITCSAEDGLTREQLITMIDNGDDVSNACTSNITDFSLMFSTTRSGANTSVLNGFNQDLSRWDVSNGQKFMQMFEGTTDFAANLNGWEFDNANYTTSSTGAFDDMFKNTRNTTANLSNWTFNNPTSGEVKLSYIFSGVRSDFKPNLSNWTFDSNIRVSSMFHSSYEFSADVSSWNTSKLRSLFGMFSYASNFKSDIGAWDTSNVTDFAWTFMDTTNMNQDLRNWDVSKGTRFADMFTRSSGFSGNLSGWSFDSAKAATGSFATYAFENMFDSTSNFTANLSGWTFLSNNSSLTYIFSGTNSSGFKPNVSNWKLGNVGTTFLMSQAGNNPAIDITSWDVSELRSLYGFFLGASSFNQDISGWNVGNVTNFNSAFKNATSFNQDISGWNVEKATKWVDFSTGSGLTVENTPLKFR